MMWRVGRNAHVAIRSCKELVGVAIHQIRGCEWCLKLLTIRKKCIIDLNRMPQTWTEYFINLHNADSVILAARL